MNWKTLTVGAALLCAACGDDKSPIEPVLKDHRGSYELTQLTFDPQGSLAAVDLLTRVGSPLHVLVLATNGRAQLILTDSTGLTQLVDGDYTGMRGDSVRIEFDEDDDIYGDILMSERMVFHHEQTGQITFSGSSPDGISRAVMLALVPEWEDEQLLDPVPGTLTMKWSPRLQATGASRSH